MLSFAQVVHEVEVFGGGLGNPFPQYLPQSLSINIGDTVRWTATQGKHNVYGESDDFPNNPVHFSSGVPEFAPWTYDFVFDVAGFYGYHCTQPDHSQTQFGDITVLDPTGVEEHNKVSFSIFPNPANDKVNISFEGGNMERVELFDINGKLVKELVANNPNSMTVDVQGLSTGRYMFNVHTDSGNSFSEALLIK